MQPTHSQHLFLTLWTRDIGYELPFEPNEQAMREVDRVAQSIFPGQSFTLYAGTTAFNASFLLGKGMAPLRAILSGNTDSEYPVPPPAEPFEGHDAGFVIVPMVVRSDLVLRPAQGSGSMRDMFGAELDMAVAEFLENALRREVFRATLMTLDQLLSVPLAENPDRQAYTELLKAYLSNRPYFSETSDHGAIGFSPDAGGAVIVANHSTSSYRRAVPKATPEMYAKWRASTMRFAVTMSSIYGITVRYCRASIPFAEAQDRLSMMQSAIITTPWMMEAIPLAMDLQGAKMIRVVSQSFQGQTNVRWNYYLVDGAGKETRARVYYVLHPATDQQLLDALVAEASAANVPVSFEAEAAASVDIWL